MSKLSPGIIANHKGLGPWHWSGHAIIGGHWLEGSLPYLIDEVMEECASVDMDSGWEPQVSWDAESFVNALRRRGFDLVRMPDEDTT